MCRCAEDPDQRHGPYHEWSRRVDGRLVHTVLTPDLAEDVAEAIERYRAVQALIHTWDHETARILIARNQRNRRS